MKKWMLSLLAVLLLCGFGFSQTGASVVGHADTQLGAYDSIDLSSLYLGLKIPVVQKSGSAKLPFQYSIVGYPNVAPGVWGQTSVDIGIPLFPFGGIQYTTAPVICGTGSNQIYVANYSGFGFVDGNGAYWSFGNPLAGGSTQLACQSTTQSFRTVDGSLYLTATVNTSYAMHYTVTDSQGNVLINNAQGGGFVTTGWAASTNFGLSAFLYDSHGNVQITTACASNVCTSGTTAPTYNATVGGTTTDGKLTWTNLGLPTSKIADTNGNSISVAITNLTGTTQAGGGSYADASRNYAANQVWTYTDALNTTPLTVTYPPLQTSTGGLNSTAQVTMAYTDANGTAEDIYLNESYMALTKPNAPTGLPLLQGPTILGVNSTINGGGVISGNSFGNPSPYPYFPTSVVYPDGSTIGLAYEAVPGASGTGTGTIASVGITNDLATIDFTGLNTLTKASQVTGIAVTGTAPNQTVTFTVSGTNPWAANDVAILLYMSPANLAWDGFSCKVSSVTSSTVVCNGIGGAPIANPESQGWLAAPVGALNFSGLTNALFLDGVTPSSTYFGTQPNFISSAQAYTSSIAWYYYNTYPSYNGYMPKVGDVVDIAGFQKTEFNGTSKTIASIVQGEYGGYFTVNGSFTQGDVSGYPYYGAVLPVSLAGADYLQFSFVHANYTQASDTGTISNGGSATTTTGRLAQITLPTGGTIKYVYSGGENNSGINTDGSYATVTRTTSDGTTTFTHTPGVVGSNVPAGAFGQSFSVSTPNGLLIETGQVQYSNYSYYVYPVVQANITNLQITGTTGNYIATATFTGGTSWIATGNAVYVYAPSSEYPGSYDDFPITGVTGNTFTFFCGEECNGTFNGAVTGYATTGTVYDDYAILGGSVPGIISYGNGATSVASTTTIADPAGNETVLAFAGLRQVDNKVFQGTPPNALLNSGFESGTLSPDWLLQGGSTTPWSGSVTAGSIEDPNPNIVAYTDVGTAASVPANDPWAANASTGAVSVYVGVVAPSVPGCCPPTTQTDNIVSVKNSGTTYTATLYSALPSSYVNGASATVSFQIVGSSTNYGGTFPITATTSSPPTISFTYSGGPTCTNTYAATITSSYYNSNYGYMEFFGTNNFTDGEELLFIPSYGLADVDTATSSQFNVLVGGQDWLLDVDSGYAVSGCSGGQVSVPYTPPPPTVSTVQVAQVGGSSQWTVLVTMPAPISNVFVGGNDGTQFTFAGMTHATWLNGKTLRATTWDGQAVLGFSPPSGTPEPYASTADVGTMSWPSMAAPQVYTSDLMYLTNIQIPTTEVPVGSIVSGLTFTIPYIEYTEGYTGITAQLVNDGVLVGTQKTCVNTNDCTFGSSTDTWGTSNLVWGPNVGIAIGTVPLNPQEQNSNGILLCCQDIGQGFTIAVNTNTFGAAWSATQSQAQSGLWSATSATTTNTQLIALNSSGSQYMPINPNDQIQYNAYLLRTTGTGKMWLTCAFYDATQTFISYCPNLGPITQQTSVPGGGTLAGPFAPASWTLYSGTAFAPRNAAYVSIYAEVHGQGDPDTSFTTVYVDNVSFTDLTTGGLLQEVVTCYNSPFLGGLGNNTAPCTNPSSSISANTPVTEADVYTFKPGTPTTTPYAGGGASVTTKSYDSFGRVTSTASYDYGQTTAAQKTTITYGTYTGTLTTSATASDCSPLANTAITAPVCMTTTTDSSGNVLNETVFQYDANGNPTATNVIDVLDTQHFVFNYTYSSKGALATASDINGNSVTYTTTNCNDLLPATVADKLLSVSMTYDCNSAQPKTYTDPDGGVWSSLHTDPLSRLTSQTTPLTSGSFTDTMTYAYTPTSFSRSRTFNSGNTVVRSLITLDGLGRDLLNQNSYSSTQFTTVQNTYNTVGLLKDISIPFLSAAGATGTGLTNAGALTYDALGRRLTMTNVNGGEKTFKYIGRDIVVTQGSNVGQVEVNGLGQIVSYCQVTSQTGSGACGQDNPETGFLATYTYNARGEVIQIVQNAQPSTAAPQESVETYDGFGRQLSDSRPETTLFFVWDTDSSGTCPSSAGDIVRINDMNGNTICYSYDYEHRLLSRTYPSGPNSASTPAKYFVYDTSSTFTCPTGANQKGRLAEMYTGSSSSKTTDEGYCYSARGDLTDVFETTPHSGGYFHTTASYWEDGSIKTLGGIPGITGSFTYTPNYVWTNTVTGPSSASLVKSVTSSFGVSPSVVTYGSNDTDTFNQDTKQNFTGFSSTVGSSTVSNVWTLNSNGTPSQQVITNPFDTVASGLTCSYSYDALVRPLSFHCINTSTSADVWGQNYAFDEFGNIKKTVPAGYAGHTWAPTYNLDNNQYTGSTFAYDSDGQIANDTLNTYTWGADGKVLSVTNIATGKVTTYTYDAAGILVEEATSGVTGHTQFVLSPMGKVATTTSTQ